MSTIVEVILTQTVDGQGTAGQSRKVKRGFANYLVREGLAIPFSAHYLKMADSLKKKEAKRLEKEKEAAEIVAKEVNGKTIEIEKKAHDEGRLYGSVTSQELSEIINKDYEVKIDRKKFVMPEHIKEAGDHVIKIKLHPDVVCEITLRIKPQVEH